MMQVTNICSKCRNEIEHGKEKYLQLIDRNKPIYYADESGGVVLPTVKWEYCLCPKCFNDFNNSMYYPFKEMQK